MLLPVANVSENDGKVVFLHRIVPGGTDKSYGVHVGNLAGLPRSVVNRAWEILEELENGQRQSGPVNATWNKESGSQMHMFRNLSPVVKMIYRIDIANMTPLEAINKLYELQKESTKYNE